MKLNQKLLCILSALAICLSVTLPVFAEDETELLRVYPKETSGGAAMVARQTGADAFTAHTSSEAVVEIIIRYEGFRAYPYSDPSGTYIGYGSNYNDAVKVLGENCEPITEAQAEQVTRYQLGLVDEALNRFLQANNIAVNQNQYDALADFTYGCGIGWTTYRNEDGTWCKLKQMLLDDPSTWTAERTAEAFGTWVRDATGTVLPGLVRRREEEAEMFMGDAGTDTDLVFTDVKTTAWYYTYVLEAKDLGLMNGVGNGKFLPEKALTRAQLVQVLANYAGVELSGYTESVFSDVAAGTWYAPAVAWAAENGYVNGYENGTFQPDKAVTREQLCCILSRYLTGQGQIFGDQTLTFTDSESISGYALEDVRNCASIGLVNGLGDGRFAPKNQTTRAQAAAILVRIAQL